MLMRILQSLGEAAARDLADRNVRAQLRRNIEYAISARTGLNLESPLVKPYWDGIYEDAEKKALDFIQVAETDPDTAGEFLKEQADAAVDNFTESLKKRLAAKNNE